MPHNPLITIQQRKRSNSYTMSSNEFHKEYEIYYLLSGERNYFIEERTYHILSGDLVFINKHDLHKTFSAGMGTYERILIFFGDEFTNSFNQDVRNIMLSVFNKGIKRIRLNLNEQIIVENALFELLREQENKLTGYHTYMETLMSQLLIYTGRLVEAYTEKLEPVHPLNQKIQDVVEYINEHYSDEITLTSLSKAFFISPHYLSRMFKQVTGFSLVDYVNMVRINNAQKLLRETNDQVIHIAEKVGFDHISHFGRVFKTKTLTTPLQYRKLSKTKK